jgi:hypothetical protein
MGVIADTLRASLRDLAEADARLYRGLATELAPARQGKAARSAIAGAAATSAEIAAAIALLEANGYTVTR